MKISIQKESTRRSPHSHRTGHKRATSAAEERTLRRRRRVHFLTDVPNSVCMCAEGWMEGAAGSTRSPANGPTQLLWRVHVHWQTMYYRLGLSETESERQPPSLRPPRSYWLAPTPRRQHQHSAFDQQSALALRWNIYKYISRSACVHIYMRSVRRPKSDRTHQQQCESRQRPRLKGTAALRAERSLAVNYEFCDAHIQNQQPRAARALLIYNNMI